MSKEWTIVGMWDDSRETWIEYGKGETADEATMDALGELNDGEVDLEDLSIVAVFPGRLSDGLNGIGPVSATEFRGVDDDQRSYGPHRKNRRDAR